MRGRTQEEREKTQERGADREPGRREAVFLCGGAKFFGKKGERLFEERKN